MRRRYLADINVEELCILRIVVAITVPQRLTSSLLARLLEVVLWILHGYFELSGYGNDCSVG